MRDFISKIKAVAFIACMVIPPLLPIIAVWYICPPEGIIISTLLALLVSAFIYIILFIIWLFAIAIVANLLE